MAAQFSQTVRALANDSSRGAHLIWIIAGGFLGCWALWFALAHVSVYEVSQRARLEVRKASHQLDAQIAGQVTSSSLVIGREVAEGEVLVELDSTRDRLRLAEEQARLAGLANRMASLRREIEARQQSKLEDVQATSAAVEVVRSHIEETQAAIDFSIGAEQRVAKLMSTGGGAKVDALKAAAETQKLTAARNAWAAEIQRLEREARSKELQNEALIESLRHTLATLESNSQTSKAAVARLSSELGKYQLRAPIAGRLGDVAPYRVGAYVAEGQRLATILPADELIIVADFVPSFAFGRVQVGQQARLRLDGFPWAQYGTVSATVSSVAGEVRDNLVRVELSVDALPRNGLPLQHGQPGSVEVTIEEASPAALVLRSAGLLLGGSARAGTVR